MSKEIENILCDECESEFRLIYNASETSGLAKFCPFCGSDIWQDIEEEDEISEDD